MPVTFKLVGGTINSNVLEITRDMIGSLRLSNIQSIFQIYGLTEDEIKEVKFVTNSVGLKDNDQAIEITKETNCIIFVFSAKSEIKEKLMTIFKENCTNSESKKINITNTNTDEEEEEEVDSELTKPIDEENQNNDAIPVLNDETVMKLNEKTVKLFQSDDFKSLVRIYYKNQDTMKTFFNFISNGDIVKFKIPEQTDKNYEKEIQMIKSLGVEETDENIKNTLLGFNGHLNLSLRALLCKKVINVE